MSVVLPGCTHSHTGLHADLHTDRHTGPAHTSTHDRKCLHAASIKQHDGSGKLKYEECTTEQYEYTTEQYNEEDLLNDRVNFDELLEHILAPCSFDWWDYAGMPETDGTTSTFPRTPLRTTSPSNEPLHLACGSSLLSSITPDLDVESLDADSVALQDSLLRSIDQHSTKSASASPYPTATSSVGLADDAEKDIAELSRKGPPELDAVLTSPTTSTRPGLLGSDSIRSKTSRSTALFNGSPLTSSERTRFLYEDEREVKSLVTDQSEGRLSIACRVYGCPKQTDSKRADEYVAAIFQAFSR